MKAVSSLITGRGHNRAILLARSLAHSLTLWGQIDAFMLDARSVGRIAGAGARGWAGWATISSVEWGRFGLECGQE